MLESEPTRGHVYVHADSQLSSCVVVTWRYIPSIYVTSTIPNYFHVGASDSTRMQRACVTSLEEACVCAQTQSYIILL